MRNVLTCSLAAALLLGACSQEPREGESADDFAARIGGGDTGQAGPQPTLTPSVQPTADAQGNKFDAGAWFVTEDAQVARAMFGAPQSEPVLTLACSQGSRTLLVSRAGAAEAAGDYRIAAGGQTTTIRLDPAGGEIPELAGSAPADAPVFVAMGEKGQSATVTGPDGTTLRVPTSAAIRRVLTACGVNL